MRKYLKKITLEKNKRGVWCLDTFKGCFHGIIRNPKGCYGICYAAKIATSKGYDFGMEVKRDFENGKHFKRIANKLKNVPFVRIGGFCDPSSDWKHTLKIVNMIKPYQKNIVIITKHWNELQDYQLKDLKGLVINTSVSALDNRYELEKRLYWHKKLKKYCKSVLRVCTVNPNYLQRVFSFYEKENIKELQDNLLSNENIIDTVLRFPKNHNLVVGGEITIKKYRFLNSYTFASKHNESIYFGDCGSCKEKCGINF